MKPLEDFDSDASDDESSDASKLSVAQRRELFKKYLGYLAMKSDVQVVSKQSLTGSKAIILSSEQRVLPPESFVFTTTPSIIQMVESWATEFYEKDGDAGATGIRLKSLFRGSLRREKMKPYEVADDIIPLDCAGNPTVGYEWLPQPTRRVDLDERDAIFLEKNTRATIRALNFSEVVLQA